MDLVEPLGSETVLHVKPSDAAMTLKVVVAPEQAPVQGERVALRFPHDRLHWFDPGTGERIR